MDTNRMKKTAEWFYGTVFSDQAISPRAPQEMPCRLPAMLRTARSLENGMAYAWQSREAVFIKQAKLLAGYDDHYAYTAPVRRYYPTYQSLTDAELRGYFSWRTQLRRGNVQKTSLSYAFLYIYELLNQIGTVGPMDGYQKLKAFESAYGALDDGILPYLWQWLFDYIIYYGLDRALLADTRQASLDRSILVLSDMGAHSQEEIFAAVRVLAPRWLARSKLYAGYPAEFERVLVRVLRRVAEHYDTRCKMTFVELYFGRCRSVPARMFDGAVFHDRMKTRSCEYVVDALCTYRCKGGLWTAEKYAADRIPNRKLDALVKTVDAELRLALSVCSPIKAELDTKWIMKLIREETAALQKEKQAAEAKRLHLDFGALARIRSDAAVTCERLATEEELDFSEPVPEVPPAPVPEDAPATPLSEDEYRLLQCLLYGRDHRWVQERGLMLSVLCDGINEKLYDEFMDSVLLFDGTPELIEDYLDDLKEMVRP